MIAVYFLIANAKFTVSPAMIYLAAFFDGLMCVVLILIYMNCRKIFTKEESKILGKGLYAMTEE